MVPYQMVPTKWSLCIATLLLVAAPSSAETVTQTVARAQQTYSETERNVKAYTRRETDLSGYSTEGGTLVAYFHQGAPRKLVAQYYGESGRATEELYFSRGRLFFVLRTEIHYTQPLGARIENTSEVAKVARRVQHRFYFSEGKMVRWINENGKSSPASKDFKTRERETLAQARSLLSKASSLLD